MLDKTELKTFFVGPDHVAVLLDQLRRDPRDRDFETIWSNISGRDQHSILEFADMWIAYVRQLERTPSETCVPTLWSETASYDLHVACVALGFEVSEMGQGYLLIPGTPFQLISGSFDTAKYAYSEDSDYVFDANVLRLRVFLESKMRRVSS